MIADAAHAAAVYCPARPATGHRNDHVSSHQRLACRYYTPVPQRPCTLNYPIQPRLHGERIFVARGLGYMLLVGYTVIGDCSLCIPKLPVVGGEVAQRKGVERVCGVVGARFLRR